MLCKRSLVTQNKNHSGRKEAFCHFPFQGALWLVKHQKAKFGTLLKFLLYKKLKGFFVHCSPRRHVWLFNGFFNCKNFLLNKLFWITRSSAEQIIRGEKVEREGQRNEKQRRMISVAKCILNNLCSVETSTILINHHSTI